MGVAPGLYELHSGIHFGISLAPFTAEWWEKLTSGSSGAAKDDALEPAYWLDGAQDLRLFRNGRDGLRAALLDLELKRDDEVWIDTTTGGPYVSGCVTQTIERVCQWKRERSPRTKVVVAIHEFGFPYPSEKIKALREQGIAVIEDGAYATGTRRQGDVGRTGDYILYSLTKHYPFPYGGLLASRRKPRNVSAELGGEEAKLLWAALAACVQHEPEWNRKRRENWEYFRAALALMGLDPYFELASGVVPGAYVTKASGRLYQRESKDQMMAAGIRSSVYFGQDGFYFPVHQFLTEYERKYILHHLAKRL